MLEEPYKVLLDNVFEGPMDLLLHLIKKNEVDIYDIPIALITDQYLGYVELMKSLNALAVTEVRDEVCQGCHMNIPPQLFVEIKKKDKLIQCPQCRRILYYKSTE